MITSYERFSEDLSDSRGIFDKLAYYSEPTCSITYLNASDCRVGAARWLCLTGASTWALVCPSPWCR